MNFYKPFSVTTGSFYQYCRLKFNFDEPLINDRINCISSIIGNYFLIGTDNGIYKYCNKTMAKIIEDFDKKVTCIKEMSGGLYFVSENCLYVESNFSAVLVKEFESEITGFEFCDDFLYILTENEFIKTDLDFKKIYVKRKVEGGKGLKLAVNNSNVYVLTETNLSIIHGKRQEWKNIFPRYSSLPDCRINALVFDKLGFLHIGTEKGAFIYDNRNLWLSPENIEYLPRNEVFDICFDENGSVYYATDIGVIMLFNGKLKYFSADRYVPSNNVFCASVSKDGDIIIAGTEKGLSVINRYRTTLSEKAAEYELIAEKYHQRRGFTAERVVYDYDMNNGYVHISDNDGLWTGYYVAAEVFRYLTNGDNEALFRARRGKNAMLLLMNVTGIPGFTARAVRYKGEQGFGNNDPEWVKSDEFGCEWKCETSSDEMTGHFFALSLYYDYCADNQEKHEIKDALRKITDHIIENKYRLCDHDGLPTTWACWDPELLNSDDRWFAEKGINSLELLAFLKVIYHMTGDIKYKELYDEFVKYHHYVLNASQQKIKDAHDCHIDDNLAFLAAFSLLRLEEDETIRRYVLCGLEDHWSYERVERQPLFSFLHAYLTGRGEDITDCLLSLEQMPLDLIFYDEYNSKRKDIVYDEERNAYLLDPQIKNPLPYDERNVFRADAGSFNLDSKDRKCAVDPSLYLLPYWMGRFFGLITEE